MDHITHLGDGAYIMSDGYQAWLAANDHNNPTVALEPRSLVALMIWVNTYMPHVAKEMIASVTTDE